MFQFLCIQLWVNCSYNTEGYHINFGGRRSVCRLAEVKYIWCREVIGFAIKRLSETFDLMANALWIKITGLALERDTSTVQSYFSSIYDSFMVWWYDSLMVLWSCGCGERGYKCYRFDVFANEIKSFCEKIAIYSSSDNQHPIMFWLILFIFWTIQPVSGTFRHTGLETQLGRDITHMPSWLCDVRARLIARVRPCFYYVHRLTRRPSYSSFSAIGRHIDIWECWKSLYWSLKVFIIKKYLNFTKHIQFEPSRLV